MTDIRNAKSLANYHAMIDVFLADGELVASDQWAVSRALKGEKVSNAEYTLRRKDTGESWVGSFSFGPIREKDGSIVGAVVVGRDITERRQTHDSHARLVMAVEQATESVVITESCGSILYVNPAFERTSGYSRAEVLGQNPRILKSGKQGPLFYREMWDTLQRGETWRGRMVNRRKDGSLYEEESTISPVRDATGAVVNYVAVKRDVTSEVQLEAQFRQSQKMEAFGQLAGGVAHDFNNILTIIRGNADLLKLGLSTEDNIEAVEEISQATERAAALTRQLLLFSRKQVLQLRDLDLNEIVNHITKMLQRILGEDICMQLRLSPLPLLVHADGGRLDQILMNLTVNARDAMPRGGSLSIETFAVEGEGEAANQKHTARPASTLFPQPKEESASYACVSVTDTGCGIPAEILPRIFEPFFTTKEVGKGSGLGLATVFGIVEQHRGWVDVRSEVGKGTTFRVYFPRRIDSAYKSEPCSSPPAHPDGGHETILLVEDEPAVRNTVHRILSRLGYRVLVAHSGPDALKTWEQHGSEVDLLLTDLVMPGGMSGIELSVELLKENPKLKVIYASGYSGNVASEDISIEVGVNLIEKPFHLETLAQTIRQLLDRSDDRPEEH